MLDCSIAAVAIKTGLQEFKCTGRLTTIVFCFSCAISSSASLFDDSFTCQNSLEVSLTSHLIVRIPFPVLKSVSKYYSIESRDFFFCFRDMHG